MVMRMRNLRSITAIFLTAYALGFPVEGAEDRRILVVPFRSAGERPDLPGYANLLTEMVVADLSGRPGVVVVERESLTEALEEADLSFSGLVDDSDAVRLGRLTAADSILFGDLQAVDDTAHAEARLVDIESTEVVATAKAEGVLNQTPSLGLELVTGILGGESEDTPEKRADVDPHPEATLHLLRGLSHYHLGEYDPAIAEFIDALRGARGAAVARYYMAEAYRQQGRSRHAWVEYRRFLEEFPDHPLATDARERLAEVESETPEIRSLLGISE
jgi:TolB-like protein